VTASAPEAPTPKPVYGTAPTAQPGNGLTAAQATHKARLEALESAIPGITSVAYVFTVGKDAQGKLCKDLHLCVNNGFTYVELPDGKAQKVGKLDPEEVRRRLKACGYGFTKQKAQDGTAMSFWATANSGRPVSRRPFKGYNKRNVAAQLVDEE
jgi:hypothetical protein